MSGSSAVDPFQEVRHLPTKLLMKDDQDSDCETIDDDDNDAGDNDPYRRHVHLLSPRDNHHDEDDDDDDSLIHPDEYINEHHSNDNALYQIQQHKRYIRPEQRLTSNYHYTPPSSYPSPPRQINQPELLSVSEKARLFSQLSVPSLPSPYGSRRNTHSRTHSSSSQRSSRRAPPPPSSSRHPPPMHPLHENNTNIPHRRHHNNSTTATTKKPPRHPPHSASRDKENTTNHHRPAPSQPFPHASSSYSPRTLSYLRDNPAMRHTLPAGDRLRGGGTAFAGRLGTKGCGMQREKRKVLRTWTGGMELVSPGVLCGATAGGFRFDEGMDKYGDGRRHPLHASPPRNKQTKHRRQQSHIPSPPHPSSPTSSHRRSLSCPAPSAPPLSSPEPSSLHLMDDGTSPTCHDDTSSSAASDSSTAPPDDFDLLLRDACHQSACSMQTPVPPPPLEDVFAMACRSDRRLTNASPRKTEEGEMRHLASKLTDDTDVLEDIDDDDFMEEELSKMTEESVKDVHHRPQQQRRRRRRWFRRKKDKSKTDAMNENRKSGDNISLEVVDLYGRGGVVMSTVPVKSYCTCSVM